MKRIIGEKYLINPHGCTEYPAIYVGKISLRDELQLRINGPEFEVFKFDFYKFGDPTCFVCYCNDRAISLGHTPEEMINNFRSSYDYKGLGRTIIHVGDREYSVDQFIKEASATSMKKEVIDKTILLGRYQTTIGNHGEIKICPKCDVLRDTGCSACGCGSCIVCGHRWCCNSQPPQWLQDSIKVSI